MIDPTAKRGGLGPVVAGDHDAARNATGSGRATVVTPILVALLTIAAAAVAALTDRRLPTSTDWHVIWVLAVVGVVSTAVAQRFSPPDDDAAPPWDVHTVWILPAALLTPPAAFGVLVALSVAIGMLKPAHPLRWRVMVACTTVLTTLALHIAARAVGGFALAAIVGIAALWVVGAAIAVVMAQVMGTPSGTALWLDVRWSLVELGCAISGMLIAVAMLSDPTLGLTGVAPTLFAAFALRWPELTWYARIDPKTGLPNARHWDERTRELLTAAQVRRSPGAVMIIDLDRFKHVNDTYGHLAGDQVLSQVADVLRAELRPGDLVGRFGGEEFVVTIFGLSPASAVAVAERVRMAVAARRYQLSGPRGVDSCSITCSVGVAASDRYGYDLTRLLDMADVALAAGKAAGRNRVQDAHDVPEGTDISSARASTDPRRRSVVRLLAHQHAARRAANRRPGGMSR